MKKNLIYALLFCGLSLLSCNSKTELHDAAIESIPVTLNKTETGQIEEIIEKIEIIPLETDDNCLMKGYKKMAYYKDAALYLIVDYNDVVFLFTGEGKHIANSKNVQGPGPSQYGLVQDFLYNPYSKCVEILDPYGIIYRYDTLFKFVEKISLEQREIVFSQFMPLSATQYILTSARFDTILYFCDFDKRTVERTESDEANYIHRMNMQNPLFFRFDDRFLYIPLGWDYHFYEINTDSMTVKPVIKLDFGGGEVSKKSLERRSGYFYKSDDSGGNNQVKLKVLEVIKESEWNIPIVKLISERYLYLQILTSSKRSNYIYKKKKKKGYYQATDDAFKIFFGMELYENVLFTLPQPFEIEEYIDRKYMSEQDIEKMKNIREDDNPIIVKYYLK
jgi:hypothetical protein